MTSHADIVRREEREWEKHLSASRAESRLTRAAIAEFVSDNCRPAKASDYQRFLDARTKECTNYYGYNFPTGDFYVARRDCKIPPACGAMSINVIAPSGIKVEHEGDEITHCNIYSMDDPDRGWFVPSYNNANKG